MLLLLLLGPATGLAATATAGLAAAVVATAVVAAAATSVTAAAAGPTAGLAPDAIAATNAAASSLSSSWSIVLRSIVTITAGNAKWDFPSGPFLLNHKISFSG